jgi:hypothetical protein
MSDLHAFTVDLSRPHSLLWLEFELPSCPSKNKKKQKLGNSTPEVEEWAHQADMAYMALPPEERQKLRATCFCEFEAQFLHGRNNRADFHNYEEFLFDWLQDRGFIKNDKQCEWRASGWADNVGRSVPKGRVIVRLRPWMAP